VGKDDRSSESCRNKRRRYASRKIEAGERVGDGVLGGRASWEACPGAVPRPVDQSRWTKRRTASAKRGPTSLPRHVCSAARSSKTARAARAALWKAVSGHPGACPAWDRDDAFDGDPQVQR